MTQKKTITDCNHQVAMTDIPKDRGIEWMIKTQKENDRDTYAWRHEIFVQGFRSGVSSLRFHGAHDHHGL